MLKYRLNLYHNNSDYSFLFLSHAYTHNIAKRLYHRSLQQKLQILLYLGYFSKDIKIASLHTLT